MEHTDIKGFTDQSDMNKAFVNRNKEAEERLLRITDELKQHAEYDQRWIALAVTYFQFGFMALNRGVFQPQRIELPEDKEPEEPMPAIYVGPVFREAKMADGSVAKEPVGMHDQVLIAVGPHWYVKSEWDNYQRRLKGEPEVPVIPTDDKDLDV